MDEVLRAIDVSFAYPQDSSWSETSHQQSRVGLRSVSLSVQRGEGVLIAGQSGCGKSTLARCLTGLIPHLYHGDFSGQVTLADKTTEQASLWELSERAGMVFQNPATQMLAATVEDEIIFGLENLGLPVPEIRRRLGENLQRFNLLDLRDRNPQTLSGGEQQKLALAAIVARQPQVLVLDEPLSMLDTTAVYDFVSLLQDAVASGTSVVICEHRSEPLSRLQLRVIDLGNNTGCPPSFDLPNWPYKLLQPFELLTEGLSVDLGRRRILDNVDLSLRSGQVSAILGRNGSGKTTLLRSISGFQPYQGKVSVCNAAGFEQAVLGMVFQNPDLQLFNPSVKEEILFRLARPDLEFYSWLLDGLDLRRYENTPPLLLSEGEKRRLALATVLMRSPKHGILLDEPALGQDKAHKEMLMMILRAVASAGYVVAFATHDLELAAQADRLILLGAGSVVASGTPKEMLSDGKVWEQVGLRLPEWVTT